MFAIEEVKGSWIPRWTKSQAILF